MVLLRYQMAARRGRGGWGAGGNGRRRGSWQNGPWQNGPGPNGPWQNGPQNGPWQNRPGQNGPGPDTPGQSGSWGNSGVGSPPEGGNGAGSGWSAGGGPAGGGWSSQGPTGDDAIAAGSGRGAGEHLAGAGSAPWGATDWKNDPRPAAASVPAELFPQQHAAQARAQSPVDVGLAGIRRHDPAFDLEQFTQHVQKVFFIVEEAWAQREAETSRRVMADGLWQAHRAQIQAYISAHKHNVIDNLALANVWPVAANRGEAWETITVRVVASCTDYDVEDLTGRVLRGDTGVRTWEEDWTFQRAAGATTRPDGPSMGTRCPNCGAPLDVELEGTCRYCKAPIMSGQFDWVLARISQVG